MYSRKFYNLSMRIDGLKIDGIANIEPVPLEEALNVTIR
jgi:hypothetical protein